MRFYVSVSITRCLKRVYVVSSSSTFMLLPSHCTFGFIAISFCTFAQTNEMHKFKRNGRLCDKTNPTRERDAPYFVYAFHAFPFFPGGWYPSVRPILRICNSMWWKVFGEGQKKRKTFFKTTISYSIACPLNNSTSGTFICMARECQLAELLRNPGINSD